MIPRDQAGVTGGLTNAEAPTWLRKLGVGWVRTPITALRAQDPAGRSTLRQWAETLKREAPGIRILATFRWWLGGPNASTPPNPSQYRATLDVLADTMEGMVDAWQIENEVWVQGANWWAGTRRQYLDTLAIAYDVLHRRGLPVLAAGLTSESIDTWWRIATGNLRPTAQQKQTFDTLRVDLRAARCDALDGHLYHRLDQVAQKVTFLRQQTGRPLWVTECAGPDQRVTPWTEAKAAADLAVRIPAILGAGAERAFWLGLYEWTEKQTNVIPGLIHTNDVPMPAFGAYQRLLQ